MAAKKRTRERPVAVEDSGNEMAETLKAIHSRFGKNVATKASEDHQPDRISTGVFMLDLATLGGIPHNRITMIVGERHAGKTMMSDMITANAQRQYPDQQVVKIDVEGTHESVWAEKLGVDTKALHLIRPETGEAAVDIADAMVRTKEVSLIIVDSIAALTPMKEVDASAEDSHVGLQSRLVGGMIRKVSAGLIAERNRGHFVTVLFLNQFRSKVGVVYGDPRSIPGGKALEFATSLQLIIKNKEHMGKDAFGVDTVGENEHSFDIKKNKLNSGPREGEFRVRRIADEATGLSEGEVDDASTMLAYAKKFGVYTGAGSRWVLDFKEDRHEFRGLGHAVSSIYADRDLYWRLRCFLIQEQARHLGMPDSFLERFD